MSSSVTPWTAARQASLSITTSRSLLKLTSTVSVMPSKHLILCRPRLLLPSIFPSIKVFSNESVLHIQWPKYYSFSISPSNEYSGLISFRIDLFNLLSVQGLSRVFSNTTFGEHSSPTLTSGQIDGGKMETVADFIFLGSQITVDGDCSHEIKRHLLLGRKAMTNCRGPAPEDPG